MPTVSIIIPVYGTEECLEQCVDSVLAQTFTDYEVWLVDDGSPDGAPAICDRYVAQDPRIHVIHQENSGLSAARNAGLDRASGEFVYFLDSDDYIKPEMLETTVREMRKGYDLVCFRHYDFVDGFVDGEADPYRLPPDRWEISICSDEQGRVLLLYKMPMFVWNRLYRRFVIEENGLRFYDNREIFAEDMYFNLCYYACVEKVLYIPDCLYFYRIRLGSLAHQAVSPGKTPMLLGKMSLGAQVAHQWIEQHGGRSAEVLLEEYPLIYFLHVRFSLANQWKTYGWKDFLKKRKAILAMLEERGQTEVFTKSVHEIIQHSDWLKKVGSFYSNHRDLLLAGYVLNGKKTRFLIQMTVLRILARLSREVRHVITGAPVYSLDRSGKLLREKS